MSTTDSPDGGERTLLREWNWHPPVPLDNSPLFAWPLRPAKIAEFIARAWFPLTERLLLVGLAVFAWFTLQPALDRCRQLAPDWIAAIHLRNLGLMILVAGGLHLYFYTYKRQGEKLKFDAREMARNAGGFLWGNQV